MTSSLPSSAHQVAARMLPVGKVEINVLLPVLSKHPLHILMCVQWQYAFIKEKISTLFSSWYH